MGRLTAPVVVAGATVAAGIAAPPLRVATAEGRAAGTIGEGAHGAPEVRFNDVDGEFRGDKIDPPDSASAESAKNRTLTGNLTFPTAADFTPSTGRTYKVFQRGDIDWDMVRTAGDKRFIGKSNAEAANAGLPPQLGDGSFATLHHSQQSARGPWFEASTRYHNIGTAKKPPLHPYRGAQNPDFPLGRGPGSLREEFQTIESPEYWQWRELNR